MTRHENKATGVGAALLALVIALVVALTLGVVGLGSTSPATATVTDTSSTTYTTYPPSDSPTVTPTVTPTDTPTATDTTTPTATPTATPTSTEPAACVEADKRTYFSTDGHAAIGAETGARVTKPVPGDSLIYVDVRGTDVGVQVDMKYGSQQYYSAWVDVPKKVGCKAISLTAGRWTLDLMGKTGGLDRYIVQMSGVSAPRLSTFRVRHVSVHKYRVVWTMKHASTIKVLLLRRRDHHVIRTVLVSHQLSGARTMKVTHQRRKLLKVIVTGPGGRLVRLVKFPR